MPVVPDELAVPNELVPGGCPPRPVPSPVPFELVELFEFELFEAFVPGAEGVFAEFPAPLGSFPELFKPPTFAGPAGTPLTPAVPAPAEPALGDPAALPEPEEGPLAAPPALPAEPPPAPPPPPPAASATAGIKSVATSNNLAVRWFLISGSFDNQREAIKACSGARWRALPPIEFSALFPSAMLHSDEWHYDSRAPD
jgi:hypothetical protein